MAKSGNDRAQTPQAETSVQSGRDNKICATPLFRIRHLLLQNCRKSSFGHSGSTHHTLTLQHCRCRNDDDVIAARGSSTFIQQRDVEHGNPLAASARQRQKSLFGGGDHRMQNTFELRQRLRIAEHSFAEALAVDPAIPAARTRKSRLDLGGGLAARSQ